MRPRDVVAKNLNRLKDQSATLSSIKRISLATGIPNGTVGRICKAEVGTSVDQLEALAEAFEVEPWQLLQDAPATAVREPRPAYGRPTITEALPVVLDAMAAAPEQDKLRAALLAVLADDAPAYRQRLAELLAPVKPPPRPNFAASRTSASGPAFKPPPLPDESSPKASEVDRSGS